MSESSKRHSKFLSLIFTRILLLIILILSLQHIGFKCILRKCDLYNFRFTEVSAPLESHSLVSYLFLSKLVWLLWYSLFMNTVIVNSLYLWYGTNNQHWHLKSNILVHKIIVITKIQFLWQLDIFRSSIQITSRWSEISTSATLETKSIFI